MNWILWIWITPLALIVLGWAVYGRTHRNPQTIQLFGLGFAFVGLWIVGFPFIVLVTL